MIKNKLEEYTEAEFLAFLNTIFNDDYDTEQQTDDAVS
ncbi:bacteriocin immunity protein, partial [Xenorhabdus bovienii]